MWNSNLLIRLDALVTRLQEALYFISEIRFQLVNMYSEMNDTDSIYTVK